MYDDAFAFGASEISPELRMASVDRMLTNPMKASKLITGLRTFIMDDSIVSVARWRT
jgi:hypothetical protein